MREERPYRVWHCPGCGEDGAWDEPIKCGCCNEYMCNSCANDLLCIECSKKEESGELYKTHRKVYEDFDDGGREHIGWEPNPIKEVEG
jgi:hypothetical protein